MTLPALLVLSLAVAPAPTYVPAPPEQVALYFNRPITVQDLDGKGLRDLALLRNTIYARWGWDGFRKKWLHDYFHAQPWFKPNARFNYGLVSKLDLQNAHTIGRREAGFTHAQLLTMEVALFTKYRVSNAPQGMTEMYEPDPKSTLATLPLEARTELGLIERAMGFFALDTDDHLADPNALDKLLKVDDLRQLSGRDLRILRNTIYARRGRPFKSPVLRQYFADKDWYHADPSYTDARLTANDKRNVAMVKSVEDELGGPITDDEQEKDLVDPNFDRA